MHKKVSIDNNPFFVYIISFTLPVLLYQLDWSYLYPPLSFGLIAFFLITFIVSAIIGLYIHKRRILVYHGIIRKLNFRWIFIGITLGNILNFAYERQIPLLSVLNKITQDNYGSFGIPTFNVFISTYGAFMTVYLFNCYLVDGNKKYLWGCLYLFIFPLMIFSRGAILLNLSNMFFLYLFSTNKSKVKIYSKIVGLILIILMGFGYLGNLRTSNQMDKSGNLDDIILQLGEAKPAFEKSHIPHEFFWSYIYISSPLANLQNSINKSVPEYSLKSVFRYVNYELIFDSISKRTGSIVNIDRNEASLIVPYLTVSTVFAISYADLGWVGMAITFLVMMFICIAYLAVLKSTNAFFATGLAILNTLILFSLFDNMISFTGLSFQLLYPLILSIRRKKAVANANEELINLTT
jgi:hypothetical protein